MGAGADPKRLARALRSCQFQADKHTERTGLKTTARVIRASNGETAIVFDIVQRDGKTITLLIVKD